MITKLVAWAALVGIVGHIYVHQKGLKGCGCG